MENTLGQKTNATAALVGHNGQPLDAHVVRLLVSLKPRLCRQFPTLRRDDLVDEILESAGRRLTDVWHGRAPLDWPRSYAWATVRNIAISYLRRGDVRVRQSSVGLSRVRHRSCRRRGELDDVERVVLLRELLGQLSPEERLVCLWKKAGFTSREIADRLGRSVTSVDTLYSRAKARLRQALADNNA